MTPHTSLDTRPELGERTPLEHATFDLDRHLTEVASSTPTSTPPTPRRWRWVVAGVAISVLGVAVVMSDVDDAASTTADEVVDDRALSFDGADSNRFEVLRDLSPDVPATAPIETQTAEDNRFNTLFELGRQPGQSDGFVRAENNRFNILRDLQPTTNNSYTTAENNRFNILRDLQPTTNNSYTTAENNRFNILRDLLGTR